MSYEEPESVLENYLGLAIAVMCAWLVPHVAIDIAEYRHEIAHNAVWKGRQEQGMDTITNSAIFSVIMPGVTLSASAAGVALTTQGMDWRVQAIVTGLSRGECDVCMVV